MNLRTCPDSSRKCDRSAGNVVSISVISAGKFPALDCISRVPFVCF